MTIASTRTTRFLALAGATLGLGLTAPIASAKTYRGAATDAAGDGPVPGRDLVKATLRYSTDGTLLVRATLAGPVDPAAADAVLVLVVGSTCKRAWVTGGGLFSSPATSSFLTVKGDKPGTKPRTGTGKVSGNAVSFKVKSSAFKGKKAGCFALLLADPATVGADSPTVFDAIEDKKL